MKEVTDTRSSQTDLCYVDFLSREKLNRIAGSVIIPLHCADFSLFPFRGKKKKSLGMKRRLLRLSIFCSVLHLADFPTGACWTWWVLIQRQLAVLMDDQPSASFFSFSFPFFFFFFFAMRAADRGGERRGETKERIVIWERRTDWVSKSLAPAGLQEATCQEKVPVYFQNGKMGSLIRAILKWWFPALWTRTCTRIAEARIQPCTYYITSTMRVKSMQVHRVNEIVSHPEMYARAHMSRMERYVAPTHKDRRTDGL